VFWVFECRSLPFGDANGTGLQPSFSLFTFWAHRGDNWSLKYMQMTTPKNLLIRGIRIPSLLNIITVPSKVEPARFF
jgi:hypothetical protein